MRDNKTSDMRRSARRAMRNGVSLTAAAVAIAWSAACGGDGGGSTALPVLPPVPPPPANRAPVATVSAIPPQSGETGQTVQVDVSPLFSDPDGDALTYSAATSDASVADASVAGSVVTVSLVSAGTATITVTATDPGGLSASLEAAVTVTQANRAPVATVSAIPPQSGETGQTVQVDVSPLFSDPDGDALTYAAATSDASVADASVAGSVATLSLVGAGTATITVTATDPGGLSASLEAAVTVTQANRAPTATGDPPGSLSLPAGQSVPPIDVSAFFSDPDGDQLTYTAESSNPSVVTATIEGSVLTLSLLAEGTATVTIVATDAGGLSLSRSFEVTVAGTGDPALIFRDDFNDESSLSNWELRWDGSATVSDGILQLTTEAAGTFLDRELGASYASWEVGVRMGRVQEERTLAHVAVGTSDPRYPYYGLWIGSGQQIGTELVNYQVSIWDNDRANWMWIPDAHGDSDAIHDASGELTEITVSLVDGRMRVAAGTTVLVDIELDAAYPAHIDEISLSAFSFDAERTTLFDWVEVRGVRADSGDGAANAAARRP